MSSAPPMSLPPSGNSQPPNQTPDGGGEGGANLRKHRSLFDQFESWASRLTSRYNWAHRLASMVFLPYAFRSGIKIKRLDDNSYGAVLPFRRFNRNWYNAMAGASLLANAEIAGGMFVYGKCGGDYTVVCKELRYRFLRPCFGPAIYRISQRQNLDDLLKTGDEFNIDVDMDVVQQLPTRGLGREVRVGKVNATFHITPKILHEQRKRRKLSGGVGGGEKVNQEQSGAGGV